MEKVIDSFDKNSIEEVRTQFQTYKGYQLVDIRVWRKSAEGSDPIPTRKGLTIKAELIPLLKESVLKAEGELKNLKETKE